MKATFSACGQYRYTIEEEWSKDHPRVAWALLNPSEAGRPGKDGKPKSDPTFNKGLGFSVRLGYGSMVYVNLFALISTKPKGLLVHQHPIGPENDAHILRAVEGADAVICAWGATAFGQGRAAYVAHMLRKRGHCLMCLGTNGDGSPKHPLYLPYTAKLQRFV